MSVNVEAVKNGVTRVADSQSDVKPGRNFDAELKVIEDQEAAERAQRKKTQEAKTKLLAEKRAAKAGKAETELKEETEQTMRRTYNLFTSLTEGRKGANKKAALAEAARILAEFETDSVNQGYTRAAIKARKLDEDLNGWGPQNPADLKAKKDQKAAEKAA
jgi:hypothetical protein